MLRKKKTATIAALGLVAALTFGVAAQAQAATTNVNFGSKSCGWPGRAAIYLGASGTVKLYQEWDSGDSSQSQTWHNGTSTTTHTLVVPVGVATMNKGTGSYTGSQFAQQGKDCRLA